MDGFFFQVDSRFCEMGLGWWFVVGTTNDASDNNDGVECLEIVKDHTLFFGVLNKGTGKKRKEEEI